jgi:hypothetical protein
MRYGDAGRLVFVGSFGFFGAADGRVRSSSGCFAPRIALGFGCKMRVDHILIPNIH